MICLMITLATYSFCMMRWIVSHTMGWILQLFLLSLGQSQLLSHIGFIYGGHMIHKGTLFGGQKGLSPPFSTSGKRVDPVQCTCSAIK